MQGKEGQEGQEQEERERVQMEERRRYWHGFPDAISEEDFAKMVENAKKGISTKRLKSLNRDGPTVYGVVRSQSGITDWYFRIDFNDYGKLTGKYWISSDNSDSSIPKSIANRISSSIKEIIPETSVANNLSAESYNRKSKRDWGCFVKAIKIIVICLLLLAMFALLIFGPAYYDRWHQENGYIQVSMSSDDLEKESVESAVDILKDCGFRNVSTNNKGDLITGWLTKEGTIDSISINEDSSFTEEDWFPADAVVVVSYHGFPED